MNSIKAVIFDLDDTLLDRRQTMEKLAHRLAKEYAAYLEEGRHVLERIVHLDWHGAVEQRHVFAAYIDQLPWKQRPEDQHLLEFCQQQYAQCAVLTHQAKETLQYVHQRYRTALLTNGQADLQHQKLAQLGIRDELDKVLTAEEAGTAKPDVRIFYQAAEQLQVDPADCMYVGDHAISGIGGAIQVGMQTVWIRQHLGPHDAKHVQPTHTIDTIAELGKLL
ncbi:HAD family hydrolase [Paenibacillus shenyangensis]|uniref:HAD family hydrolase n=1 Tax=Paenibacillus sp. A9 TaxID=1284352 RepID=UPI000381C0A3|nr:HAD family hydrolase [Paenibacillus sp. A9]